MTAGALAASLARLEMLLDRALGPQQPNLPLTHHHSKMEARLKLSGAQPGCTLGIPPLLPCPPCARPEARGRLPGSRARPHPSRPLPAWIHPLNVSIHCMHAPPATE
jgi:hypothetical protein